MDPRSAFTDGRYALPPAPNPDHVLSAKRAKEIEAQRGSAFAQMLGDATRHMRLAHDDALRVSAFVEAFVAPPVDDEEMLRAIDFALMAAALLRPEPEEGPVELHASKALASEFAASCAASDGAVPRIARLLATRRVPDVAGEFQPVRIVLENTANGSALVRLCRDFCEAVTIALRVDVLDARKLRAEWNSKFRCDAHALGEPRRVSVPYFDCRGSAAYRLSTAP